MASAIDRVTKHWHDTKSTRGQATGFDGLEIFWSPWTIDEQDTIMGPFIDRVGNLIPRPAMYARCLLIKAEDQAGNRLFSDADFDELLREANPKEVTRIGGLIIADLNRTNAA